MKNICVKWVLLNKYCMCLAMSVKRPLHGKVWWLFLKSVPSSPPLIHQCSQKAEVNPSWIQVRGRVHPGQVANFVQILTLTLSYWRDMWTKHRKDSVGHKIQTYKLIAVRWHCPQGLDLSICGKSFGQTIYFISQTTRNFDEWKTILRCFYTFVIVVSNPKLPPLSP